MLRLPDKPFNRRQLNDELAALDLPGFTGIARHSRETDDEGATVLENGAIKKVPPYIVVKSDDLSGAEITAATKTVADHIPITEPPPDPRFEDQAKAIESATTLDELKTALATVTRAL